MKQTVFLTAALLTLASSASAQTPVDPAANARVHMGPLAMSPALSLVNLGVDNNVFNEADQDAPKSDFTMTVQPKTDLWLHLGRSILSGNITEDLIYYQTYENQRSANSLLKLGLVVPLTRLTLTGNAAYVNTKDRAGFEIDVRARHTELNYDGSVEIRALSKTFFGVRGRRQTVDFDDSTLQGAILRAQLNRKMTTASILMRHQLTPLTSITVDFGKQEDRFDFSPLRDSDSTQVNFGVHFDPFALLKGGATIGYRDFKPLVSSLPPYSGLTGLVDLSYVAAGSTKLAVQAGRDVQYSFDINQPYYIQTGVLASLAQQIFGPMDAVGRIGLQHLDYRDRAGTVVVAANREDVVRTYGGGIGYHVGKDVRIGFNVDNTRRTSPIANHTYSGLRYGAAVTYGL